MIPRLLELPKRLWLLFRVWFSGGIQNLSEWEMHKRRLLLPPRTIEMEQMRMQHDDCWILVSTYKPEERSRYRAPVYCDKRQMREYSARRATMGLTHYDSWKNTHDVIFSSRPVKL